MPKRNVTQAALIGRRILKRRKELGLTQENLADRSGLSQSFLTCVERGEKGLGFDSIIKISCALETSVIRQNESDYIQRLLEQLDETQRDHTVEILKHLLIVGGHIPPEP